MSPKTHPLNRPRISKKLSGWLLASLVLLGQATAPAHDAEHELHGADEFCLHCLVQAASDDAAAPAVHAVPTLPGDAVAAAAGASLYSHHRLTTCARAPPPTLA